MRATDRKRHRAPANAAAWICVASLCSALPARAQQATPISLASLRAGFAAPPAPARLRCYWWWLNGHTDKPTITHDLEEMKAKGFGGALLVDADGSGQNGNLEVTPGPTFGSPAWVELYTHALREADRLGLEITLNINSGWNLGGPDVPPEQSSKLLTWTRTPVHANGGAVSVPLAAPAQKNGFYRQIAVLAYPLHHGAEVHPLAGMQDRIAARETGFSMSPSEWMLNPAGRPEGGSGLNQLTENDRKQDDASDDAPGTLPASATPDTTLGEVRDVASFVSSDGTLTWTPPPGEWEVLRIGYTNSDARVSTSSGAWKGRALDHLSKEAFDAYWDQTVEPLLTAAKPFHSLKYLATDSWELGGTNWTETFAAEFLRRRGYDPLPWLPAVGGRIIDTPDRTARFLTDLRRTVADLIAENHYRRFAHRAAEHGLGVQAESGGPHGAPIDALETFAASAVPQTEFWSPNPHRASDVQRFFVKEAASAANIYGRRLVAAEGETSIQIQWTESLATDLKPAFDMATTEGLNRLVWHQFTSSPASTGLPGQEYFAGTHLNPKVTWWNAAPAFFTYLNRVQFMMQQGVPVNDVLYFYGDNIPAFVRLKADDPAHVLPGYDYDVTDEDALLHSIRIDGGHLAGPSGVHWRALVLPVSGRLSLAALERIARYVREGGTVIGVPPSSTTGVATSAESARFRALVAEVWGDACAPGSHHAVSKGQVFCTQNAHAALDEMGVPPDVAPYGHDERPGAGSASPVDYAHRRVGSTDVYFIRNGSALEATHHLVLRSQAAHVELWDPVTGEARTARLDSQAERAERDGHGLTSVDLKLPAFGSVFVVFTAEAGSKAAPDSRSSHTAPLLSRSWNLTFQSGRGGPNQPVVVSDFRSWSESPEPAVRYFSGTATYTAEVTAPAWKPGERVLLRFPEVREIARVRINGKDAGTVWAKPLTLRVDPFLKPGSNHIEIEVSNLWPNRIIGDKQPGAIPITSTNITAFHADSPLVPSGLIGAPEWLIEQAAHPANADHR